MTIQNDSYPRSYFNDEPELVIPATEKDKLSVEAKSKTRRRKVKTAVQSAQSKAENRKLEMYAKQESKRAAKVQVDQRLVLWAWILGIGVAFISSAIVSFNGITSVAFFVGLSQDWMAGLFFFFVEIMYLLFLVAYLVLSSRIDEEGKPEKTWGSIAGMIAFGGIAVLANAFHTLDYWEFAWLSPQMWAGLVLSISAPIAIIAASKMASRVVFAKAIKL
jgi:cation transport ATPase